MVIGRLHPLFFAPCRFRHVCPPFLGGGRQTTLLTMAQRVPRIMTCSKLPNYLRTYRRRIGFSQRDIAYLLGGHDAARISRYEHFHGSPGLRVSLAYTVIFQATIRELFGGEYKKVENVVHSRARILAARLATNKQDSSTEQKVTVLKRIISTSADDLK